MNQLLARFRYLLTFSLVGLCSVAWTQDRLSGRQFATRSEVLGRNGMVATNHPIATQIGVEILKKGGSAVDAAIAANAFLGLADPGMNGIGGDLFAIVWDAEKKQLFGLNASGKAAANLSFGALKAEVDGGRSYRTGILSVTTPGCVDGWVALNDRWGQLALSDLLQPTIDYARDGIAVTSEVSDNFQSMEERMQRSDNPTFKATYFVNGRFPRKGEVFRNPGLANSLQLIATKGRDGFYKGATARAIVDHMKRKGGFISMQDLASNAPEWVDPVAINYRGYDVWELPPNGQGIAALQILQIMEGFDVKGMGFGSATYVHHFLEAKKLTYEDMAMFYGDPNFGEIPVETLLSDGYASTRRELIDPAKAGSYDPGMAFGDHTIYLTTADGQGNMVSLIQSNSGLFGSKEVPEGVGFALQNRGSGFMLTEPDHVNAYAPGKRPFHTIIPAFVSKDGEPFISFGLMGGDMQPQGHAQVIMNMIDFDMNLQEAGDAPRIRHIGTSARGIGHRKGVGVTYLESGFDYEVISDLLDKGHDVRFSKGVYGGYQAIMIKDGVYYGASESRKDGQAAGY